MTRLLMLVEGQSEEIFVKQTLAPYLAERGVYLQPPIVLWTKRMPRGGGFRGGASNWHQIRRNLLPLTRDTDAWITTLLDFYGLPEDFPGYQDAFSEGHPRDKVGALQARFGSRSGIRVSFPSLPCTSSRHGCFAPPKSSRSISVLRTELTRSARRCGRRGSPNSSITTSGRIRKRG